MFFMEKALRVKQAVREQPAADDVQKVVSVTVEEMGLLQILADIAAVSLAVELDHFRAALRFGRKAVNLRHDPPLFWKRGQWDQKFP